jgi:hypothetical protein
MLMPLTVSSVRAAAELVVNGGFETGNLTGWTPEDPPWWQGGVTSDEAHTGTYSLRLKEVDFIHQEFVPAVTTTGDLTLWAKGTAGVPLNPLGVTIYYSDGTSSGPYSGTPGTTWTQYTFPVNHAKLLSSIKFTTWEMMFEWDAYYVDDVSLLGPTVKLNTKIDFAFQPNPAKPGQMVKLSGTLKDVNNIPVSSAQVKVEYSINGGASWSFIWTLPTNAAGQFSQSFSAPAIGEYLVRVSYAGSASYNPSSQTVKLVVQTGVAWTYNFRMSPASDVLRFNLAGSVIHGVAESSVGPYPYANAPVIGYVDAGMFYLFIDGPDKTAPFWELVMMVGSVSTLKGNVYQTMDGTSWNGPTAYTLVPVAAAQSSSSEQTLASSLTAEPESWPATYHFRINPFVDVVHLSVDGQLIHGICDAVSYHNQPILGWLMGSKFCITTDFTKNDDGSEILYELSMNVVSISTLAGSLYRTVDGKSVVGPTPVTFTPVSP